uniref:Protein kinase domain-containing protein n=1 Tax=Physcomitrium patens TaxID=3218 RepID=A0A7I4ARR3_PHYPA|nr:probable receptor-like protein kinase At1g49730 isoform X1 [Physcomitrium patens]|eukprot:XP_024392136.1 probable receptor-like protein kinase At1g49730 isoform X1 [Physcomitrella patens]
MDTHWVWVWLTVLCTGCFVQTTQSLLGSDGLCPLDFSGLDFTSTVAACANFSYGSCCDHSKALVAVAMSQYTRNSSNLHLPPDLLEHCKVFISATFQNRNIELPVATWCALNASLLVDPPCEGLRDVRSIHKSPNYSPVEVSCGPLQSRAGTASCRNCLDSQAGFIGTLTKNRTVSESWRSCADTIFLSVASLGDSDYAMEHANCFFQFHESDAQLLPQSRCPVTLQPDKITAIVETCDAQKGNQYKCCASALLALRISITHATPVSTTFSISEKQGAACLKDLSSDLAILDMHSRFQTCNIAAEEIFHTSTHGCHGISTVKQIHELLRKQKIDYRLIQESCSVAATSCEPCRRAMLDVTFVLASARGSGMKAKVIQSCSDLVFLAITSNFTEAKAYEIGSCLFTIQVFVPEFAPHLHPQFQMLAPAPGPSSPSGVFSSRAVMQSFTRLIIVLGICIVFMGLVLFLLIMLVVIVHRKRKAFQSPEDQKPLTGKRLPTIRSKDGTCAISKGRNCRKDCTPLFRHFKLVEIQGATDNFSTIIGRGGFGTVYKARFHDGLVAAVKRMNKGTSQGEQEFCKEMELLGRLHHRHLVSLRGYCAERHERLLVYEYCENGSLKEHIHGQVKPVLTWQRRLQIALDVATGLEYLHSYCEPPLCHRDIKSSNILLNETFTAKVADFGLARGGRNGAAKFEPVTTEVRGTPGYMDPEYELTQKLAEKSDVYSFGVLLLELVTARRAINDNMRLVDWAQKYMNNESKVAFLVDSDLEHEYNMDELKSLISIIKLCTQVDGTLRPTMRQIARVLYDLSSGLNSSLSGSHFSPQYSLQLGEVPSISAELSMVSIEAGSNQPASSSAQELLMICPAYPKVWP